MANGKKDKPTSKQIVMLSTRGVIHVPDTKAACSRMIDFILHGNGTIGDNPFERVAIINDSWKKWVGQTVHGSSDDSIGTVASLCVRRVQEVNEVRKYNNTQEKCISPFQLKVKWHAGRLSGRTTILSVVWVEVVEE